MVTRSSVQPLVNTRVLDLTHGIAGPYCTKLLADYGANVIKVERPQVGDHSRKIGPFPSDIQDNETSGVFLFLNTNKRSISTEKILIFSAPKRGQYTNDHLIQVKVTIKSKSLGF